MKIIDLSFSYGDKKIFENFSIDIQDGVACFMGKSGIGKTTLLKLIARLHPVQHGKIIGLPERPAFLFQEDRLLPWFNVLKNVTLVNDDSEKAKMMLSEVGVDWKLRIDELSGGMARRVALVRALLLESDMLLLDEPFKGMDEALIEKMASLILLQNKNIIFTTHSEFEKNVMSGILYSL